MNLNFLRKFKLQNLKYLLFLILPAIFLITCFNYRKVTGPNSFINGDPDFVYLFSGAIMGDFHFRVEHIDHPGTPVQVISAVVTRVVHLFTGRKEYLDDVLSRPNYYLRAVNTFFLLLIAATMIFVGMALFKHTSLLFPTILIQLAPICLVNLIVDFSRLIPDVLLVIPLLFLVYYIIRITYKDDLTLKNKTRMLSIFTALTLSFKISSFPVLIIPLMLINSARERLKYFGLTILWFFVFSFPVLIRFEDFFNWLKDLLIHSGQYGKGEKNILNTQEFFGNIASLFKTYHIFYYLLAALLIVYVYALFKTKHRKIKNRIILGLLLAGTLQTLIVAKHFSIHYMFPMLFLIPFMGFMLAEQFSSFRKWISPIIAVVFGAYLLIGNYKGLEHYKKWTKITVDRKYELLQKRNEIVGDSPFIILNETFTYIFPETSVMFGYYFVGPQKDRFSEKLKEIYPNIFHYNDYIQKLLYWGEPLYEGLEPKKFDEIYLFFNDARMSYYDAIMKELGKNYKVELVYQQEVTNDRFFKATRIEPIEENLED